MSAQAHRNRMTETPSQRKNRELLQAANQIKNFDTTASRIHDMRCDMCVNWPVCLPDLGKGQAAMNYCARMTRGFKRAV